MKTPSIILTIALLIPVGGNILTAFSYYMMRSHSEFTQFDKSILIRSYAPALIFDFIVILTAIILNANRKYLINTVMCATVVGGFILHTVLFYTISALSTWLKLG